MTSLLDRLLTKLHANTSHVVMTREEAEEIVRELQDAGQNKAMARFLSAPMPMTELSADAINALARTKWRSVNIKSTTPSEEA